MILALKVGSASFKFARQAGNEAVATNGDETRLSIGSDMLGRSGRKGVGLSPGT